MDSVARPRGTTRCSPEARAVTGSGHGIGFGVARPSPARGPGRSQRGTPGRRLSRRPRVAGFGDATFVQADLRRRRAGTTLSEAWAAFGGLDVLVNNVGTFREPAFLDLSRSDFDFLFG